MDVQRNAPAMGIFTRRFWENELFFAAEGRGAAIFYNGLAFFLTLLFSRTHAVFGAYPFALAYLAAATRRLPAALLGAIIGALTLGERGYIYAAVYVVLVLLRLVVSHPRPAGKFLPPSYAYFDEEPPLRAASACVCGLLPAVYQLLVGGLSYASVAFALSMVIFPTLAAILYGGYFESQKSLLFCLLVATPAAKGEADEPTETEISPRMAWLLALSLGALAFTVVLGLSEYSFLGISVALLFALFVALSFVLRLGILRGGVAALFAAAGLLTPAYLPAFAALSFMAWFFSRMGILPMLSAAVAAGEVVAFLFMGAESVLYFLPELLLCATLTWPFFKSRERIALFTGVIRDETEARMPPIGFLPPTNRMKELASAYATMGDAFDCLATAKEKNGNKENLLLARSFYMSAQVLTEAARCEAGSYKNDRNAARAVARALASAGLPATSVCVLGTGKRILYAEGIRRLPNKETEARLPTLLGAACGFRLAPPTFEKDGDRYRMQASSLPRFSLTYNRAAGARGEEESGDAFFSFTGGNDRFYALLSDGMGSGKEAAVTAGIAGAYLRGMLSTGISHAVALSGLNTLLASRGEECFATVDLLEVDLSNGRAAFIKSGAAGSYVRRGDSLFRIFSETAPIGILPDLDAEKTPFRLQDGDVVILLSDGVTGSQEETLWLCEMLTTGWLDDPEEMADKLLTGARRHNQARDDMTVVLLTVKENENGE